jgi:hypothetical protein
LRYFTSRERQDERNRQVRGGGVERERREVDAEDVDRLVIVHRQRDVADDVREPDEEEQRRHEREPLGRGLRVHVVARDLVVGQVVRALDDHLGAVRLLLHPPGDVRHRPDRGHAREEEVEHGLVDREVERADLELDPRREPELLLRLELLVLAVAAEDQVQQDRDTEVDREEDQDLAARAEPTARLARLLGGGGGGRQGRSCSKGRVISCEVK